MRTLSAAGLGGPVERPERSIEALREAIASHDGVSSAGIYLAIEGKLSHWCGSVFPSLSNAVTNELEAKLEDAGCRAHLSYNAEGDLVGALVLRGELSGAADERRAISKHLQAELTQRGYLTAVFSLAAAVEEQDEAIAAHVRRISGYSKVIASAYGCEPEVVRAIQLASPLHDVGKISIPNAILYKPGKLSDEEFAETKRHCLAGASILTNGSGPFWTLAAEVASAHHERWDGTGYPRGLAGEVIPLAARIVAVADVFDALTTKRIYKPALGIEQSLNIIAEGSNRHFDPELVDAFQRAFSEILDVKTRVTSF